MGYEEAHKIIEWEGKDNIASEIDGLAVRLKEGEGLSDENFTKHFGFSRESVRRDIARLKTLLEQKPKP